jgi:hypothetical protein
MYADLSVRCFKESHMKWSSLIGIPSILIWVIGGPLAAFLILRRNKDKLED